MGSCCSAVQQRDDAITAANAIEEHPLEKSIDDKVLYNVTYKQTASGGSLNIVDGKNVGTIIKEAFMELAGLKPNAMESYDPIWNMISEFARFDFEWRVSSPTSWNILDNLVSRTRGPLDTNDTKYAAVTLNFDVRVVQELEFHMRLKKGDCEDEARDGNAIFLGVLTDRTTDSFACIGKSGFITIRSAQQNSTADNHKPFRADDIFGIRVTNPNKIQFSVNHEWSKQFEFNLGRGKLATIYLSVRPIDFVAEVVELNIKMFDYKVGKLPFRLRNVWPEGADRPDGDEAAEDMDLVAPDI